MVFMYVYCRCTIFWKTNDKVNFGDRKIEFPLCVRVSFFISAMGSVASRTQANSSKKKPSSMIRQGPALLEENETVGDDWLIDDMRPGLKRKRMDVDGVFTTTSSRDNKKVRKSKSPGNSSNRSSEQQENLSMNSIHDEEIETWPDSQSDVDGEFPPQSFPGLDIELNTDFDMSQPNKENVAAWEDDEIVELTNLRRQKSGRQRQLKLTSFGVQQVQVNNEESSRDDRHKDVAVVGATQGRDRVQSTNAPSSQPSIGPTHSVAMRLKVKIQDKTILVPILQR